MPSVPLFDVRHRIVSALLCLTIAFVSYDDASVNQELFLFIEPHTLAIVASSRLFVAILRAFPRSTERAW